MNTRRKMFLSLAISFLGILIGYFILKSDLQANSTGDMLIKLGKGLFYGMSALSLVFLILALIPQAFSAWKKFAKWFIPIATLIFIFYPQPGSGDLFSPYPEQVFKWISILYVIVSILIISTNRKS
jgi:hypothetical protein